MKAEYDQLLKNVEQRLKKLNNPYIQVDFGSDSSSSVFSKSDKSEQIAISNSQRLRNFYEQHRADNAAQRQNAEEEKKMSRSQNSAMKDEGNAQWTLERAQQVKQRNSVVVGVPSQLLFDSKPAQVKYCTQKLREIENKDAAKGTGSSN